MAHSLILGMTESGKTTLAKRLAANYRAKGISVIVLDPLSDPDWNADFQTTDSEEFLSVYFSSRRCAAFIDEAGQSVGRYNKAMETTATRGRHWGHMNHYIVQRGQMLSPNVRDQCRHLFVFALSAKDCKLYAEEFNAPEIMNATNFAPGEFYKTGRFVKTKKYSLFGNVTSEEPDE